MTRDSAVAPDAQALHAALAARGLPCEVEARDRLAVLVPTGEWPSLEDATTRRGLHQLAASLGFTHVALEIAADDMIATPSPRPARAPTDG